MRLGYSVTSAVAATTSPSEAAATVLDRASVASDVGYDYVQAGDHHAVAAGGYLQNVPTIARLTAVADQVAPLFLLPLHDPLIVAEQLGTIAAFADGVDCWCAIGGEEQVAALGIPPAERVPRFEEALSIIKQLSAGESVTVDGSFHDLSAVSINPTADPRICIGGSAEPAIKRAGRRGDAWVALPTETAREIERKRDWFEGAGGGTVIARREALVLENGDRARRRAAQTLAAGYRGWPEDADWPIVGDVDDATEELERLAAIGVDEVAIRPMTGEHAAETLRGVARARDRL